MRGRGPGMVVLGYGLAVLIGISLGLLGGGGSILTVPVLVYIFRVGVKQAVPMSLVVVGLTSLFGVIRHRGAGQVNFRAAAAFGPPAVIGALLGARVGLQVSGSFQLTVFAVVVVTVAVLMLRGGIGGKMEDRARRPLPLIALLGAGVGFLTGLVGIGGGFLYVPALTLIGGLDMKQAVGTSLALITLSCTAGLVGYLGHVRFDWPTIALFTALAFAGVGIGSALVPHVSHQALRRAFAVFLLVIGAFVLVRGEVKTKDHQLKTQS